MALIFIYVVELASLSSCKSITLPKFLHRNNAGTLRIECYQLFRGHEMKLLFGEKLLIAVVQKGSVG